MPSNVIPPQNGLSMSPTNKNSRTSEGRVTQEGTSLPQTANHEDTVVLSNDAQQLSQFASIIAATANVDTKKIHSIQLALTNEKYSTNFVQVAEKFIGFEHALNKARV